MLSLFVKVILLKSLYTKVSKVTNLKWILAKCWRTVRLHGVQRFLKLQDALWSRVFPLELSVIGRSLQLVETVTESYRKRFRPETQWSSLDEQLWIFYYELHITNCWNCWSLLVLIRQRGSSRAKQANSSSFSESNFASDAGLLIWIRPGQFKLHFHHYRLHLSLQLSRRFQPVTIAVSVKDTAGCV